ncbi:MAG: hypothetical protein RR396_01995 [Clostridiales bacterium]
MPYKFCSTCNHISYSVCQRDAWHCPYCGKDMAADTTYSRPLSFFSRAAFQSFDLSHCHTFPEYLRLVKMSNKE